MPVEVSETRSSNHIWEHATLLYRTYEWTQSIDLFSSLTVQLRDRQDRLRCLVNAGLISARLGNYQPAKAILQRAVALEIDSVIVRCALAECEVIVGHLELAKHWYETCLPLLHLLQSESAAFGYFPTPGALRANILAIWTAIKEDIPRSKVQLERIPADCIFGVLSGTSESYAEQVMNVDNPTPKLQQRSGGLLAREPQTENYSMKELTDFIRHVGPGEDQQFTLDRSYVRTLLGQVEISRQEPSIVRMRQSTPQLRHAGARQVLPTVYESTSQRVSGALEMLLPLVYRARKSSRLEQSLMPPV